MSDPSSVVPGQDLPELIGLDVGHGFGVCLLVVLDGDEGSHSAHGMHAAAVASADQELDVGVHKRHGHVDINAVWQDEIRSVAEDLNECKDVVPSATVEASDMVTELVDDLFVRLEEEP